MLKVYIEPNPVLHQKAQVVNDFDDNLKNFVKELRETMKRSGGIGLAAPQVGVLKRVAVIEIPKDDSRMPQGSDFFVLINPRISIFSRTRSVMTEGCLSIPGIEVEVERPESITVSYQTENGSTTHLSANNLLARAIQHEVDHLNGILITDHGPAKPISHDRD